MKDRGVLSRKLTRLEYGLGNLDKERGKFINFFQFNKQTGLGREYKNTELKVPLITRLLNYDN